MGCGLLMRQSESVLTKAPRGRQGREGGDRAKGTSGRQGIIITGIK